MYNLVFLMMETFNVFRYGKDDVVIRYVEKFKDFKKRYEIVFTTSQNSKFPFGIISRATKTFMIKFDFLFLRVYRTLSVNQLNKFSEFILILIGLDFLLLD